MDTCVYKEVSPHQGERAWNQGARGQGAQDQGAQDQAQNRTGVLCILVRKDLGGEVQVAAEASEHRSAQSTLKRMLYSAF